jgi:2-phosphoglycolate phosphatase
LRDTPGLPIVPPDGSWCAARAYRVRLNDRIPAAIVLPEVAGYPGEQVEVVAGVSLRDALALADGDAVSVEATGPLPADAVLFDVDGTLVDSLTAFRVVAEAAATPHGLAITDDHVREALNQGRLFWDLVVPADRADRADFMKALAADAARRWPSVLAEHGRLLPGVTAALEALQRRGLKIGIVTGARRTSLEPLRREGLLERFAVVVAKDDVRNGKPDPEGLLAAAERLGVSPDRCVYVGDTPLDIAAAHAAGMRAVAVLTGAGDCRLLTTCEPDCLVASVARVGDVLEAPIPAP